MTCHRHGLPIRFTTPTAIPLWMRMFSTPVWNILNRWLGNYWPPNFIQTETKSHRASYFGRLYKPVTQLKESEAKNPFTNCWMPWVKEKGTGTSNSWKKQAALDSSTQTRYAHFSKSNSQDGALRMTEPHRNTSDDHRKKCCVEDAA